MSTSVLRVGLLVESLALAAWARAMIGRIAALPCARLSLVVECRVDPPKRSLPGKLWRHRKLLGYLGYTALDKRAFLRPPDALAFADASGLLADVPRLRVTPAQTQYSDRLDPADVERIRGENLDVIVNLGYRILRGPVLTAAARGVWSLHHGDNRVNRGGPPGFWEVFDAHATTGCVLQVLTEDLDGGPVIDRSWAATDPTSVARNCNRYFWKSAGMVPRALVRLHRDGPEAFAASLARSNADPAFFSRPLYRPPGNLTMARLLLRHAGRTARRWAVHGLYDRQWRILYQRGENLGTSIRSFKELTPPKDRFWADPHVVREGGRHFLFIEEYLRGPGRGHVAVIEFDEQGRPGPARKVLERPYHLSNPFVFRHDGAYHMIPETIENRSIEAYRCTRFPDAWEPCATLMENVRAVDATLLEHGGRWWLFAAMAEQEGASPWEELFAFHADSPLSRTWTPHAMNPVVSDVRRARPAGRFLHLDGRLYRPAQDCSPYYGYGLRLMRVTELSPTAFAEEEVTFAQPLWHPKACAVHALSYEPGLTVLDAQFLRRRLF